MQNHELLARYTSKIKFMNFVDTYTILSYISPNQSNDGPCQFLYALCYLMLAQLRLFFQHPRR